MRFQKNLALCIALVALRAAFAGEPVPSGNPVPSPPLPSIPAKPPATEAGKTLSLGEPIPRPTAPPSLLPDEIPDRATRPGPVKLPPARKPAAGLKPQATAAELDQRIRYSKARNVAEANGGVRAAWEESRDAKTDQAKRDALKRYYDRLFAQMLAVDRGIAPLIEQRHKAEAAALTQKQIAPTVPTH